MTNCLPPKENVKAEYLRIWDLNKELMSKCREMDAQGMGKIRKMCALIRSPQAQELVNSFADITAECHRAGIKKIHVNYFKDDESAPVIDKMKDSLSFWKKEIGFGAKLFNLNVCSEFALRQMRIKPVHSRVFSASTP